MVLIARLYQNIGRYGDIQILYAPRIRELMAGPKPRGLPGEPDSGQASRHERNEIASPTKHPQIKNSATIRCATYDVTQKPLI